MLKQTRGIVLRSVKYGETSLISTMFTEHSGIQAFMLQGVRGSRHNKAALLQPATLLELTAYQKPQQHLQRLREYQAAYLYTSIQQEVVKNSIALFSAELLLRLLPEQAPIPELFDFSFEYFRELDRLHVDEVANFPLFFTIQCGNFLGFEIKGSYTESTPHLNLQDGSFSDHPPLVRPFLADEDARVLASLLQVKDLGGLKEIAMNAGRRFRLLEWYIEFLHQHTQHLSVIKSLTVLQAILH